MATTPSYTKAGVSIQCATPLYPAPRPQAAWPIPTAQSTGAQQSMLTLALVALAGQAVSGVTITSAILPSATATWTLYVQSYQGSPTTLPAPAAIPVTPVAGVISYTLTAPLAGATINCWLGSVDGISTITYPLASIATPQDPSTTLNALTVQDQINAVLSWNQAKALQAVLDADALALGLPDTTGTPWSTYDAAVAALSAGLIAAGAPAGWATLWPSTAVFSATGIKTSLAGWWGSIATAQATLQAALASAAAVATGAGSPTALGDGATTQFIYGGGAVKVNGTVTTAYALASGLLTFTTAPALGALLQGVSTNAQAGVTQINSTSTMAPADQINFMQLYGQELGLQSVLDSSASGVGVSSAAYDTAVSNLAALVTLAYGSTGWKTAWPSQTYLSFTYSGYPASQGILDGGSATYPQTLPWQWSLVAIARKNLETAILGAHATTGTAGNASLLNGYLQSTAATPSTIALRDGLGNVNGMTGPATAAPLMDGTAAVGVSALLARQDHIHASDTSRQPLSTNLTTLAAYGTSTAAAASTIALRDGSGNLTANTFSGALNGLASNASLLGGYGYSTAALANSIAQRDPSGNLTAVNLVVTAGDGDGFAFWSGAPNIYGIQMSSATDATYGGRVAGETNSDYNIYFCMQGSAYRGWNFKNTGTGVVVAGIDGSGNGRFVGNLTANSISLPNSVQLTTLSNQNLGIETAYGTTYIGMLNSSYCHYNTPATYGNYFYQPITCAGSIASAAGLSGTTGSFSTSVATPTISADWHNVNGGADLTNYWTSAATTLWTANGSSRGYEFAILDASQTHWMMRIPAGGGQVEFPQPVIGDSTITATGGFNGPLNPQTQYAWTSTTTPNQCGAGITSDFVNHGSGFPDYGSVLTMNTIPASQGGTLQLYTPYSPTYGGNGLQYRTWSFDTGAWTPFKTLYDSGNINANQAAIEALIGLNGAPVVCTIATKPTAAALGNGNYVVVTDDTTYDGTPGTMYKSNGTSYGAALAGHFVAGLASFGSVSAQALAAQIVLVGQNIQSAVYSPSYGNSGVCSGWNIAGSPFTTQLSVTMPASNFRAGNQYQIVTTGTGTGSAIVNGTYTAPANGVAGATGTGFQVCTTTMMEIGSNIAVNGWLMGDLTGRACTAINAPGSMSPSWAAGTARVFYQGNNNPVYAGGTPDITCLIIKETSPVGYASGATGWRISWTLQPKQASSTYNSNLDAMRFARVTVFNSGAAGGEQFSMPLTDRLYADVSNDADPNNGMTGDFIYWRSGSSLSYTGSGNFNGYLLVTINNASGSSQQLFFESPGALGSGTIGSTAIAATSAGLAGYAVQIAFLGTTNWQLMGAPAGAVVGTTFTATQVGTGTGTLYLCFKSQIDNVAVGACSGGTCSLSGTTFTLVSPPTVGSFQIGQTQVATGIPAGAYTVCLLSGVLGAAGSTYQMSATCTTESTGSFTGNKTIAIGQVYMISTVGTTNWTALGAINPAPGIVFTAIVAGAVTGTGTCVQMVAPPAGAVIACTTMTLGLWYSIVTLGTTTSAQWETTGAASSPTPTVGTSFQCIAEGVGTGTVVQTSAPPITSGGNSSGHSFGGGGGGGGD
jgi:hypothetical protein